VGFQGVEPRLKKFTMEVMVGAVVGCVCAAANVTVTEIARQVLIDQLKATLAAM
jgi:hypothetical protein